MKLINYEAVNDKLDIIDVAELYGVPVNSRGKSICPFHNEKTASLSYKNNRFTCFGCGARGDVVDFVSHLFHLGSADAVRRLNADFGLGMDYTVPPDNAAMLKRQKQKRMEARFKIWELNAFKTICDYVKLLHRWRREYRPANSESDQDARFVESLQKISYAEYALDLFTCGAMPGRVNFYASETNRKWVKNVEQTVRSDSELAG
jgi:hypothetical protein